MTPALTLQRPWGFAIIHLGKDVENRSWPLNRPTRIWVHQGKGMDPNAADDYAYEEALEGWRQGPEWSKWGHPTQRGVILGSVDVVGCHKGAEDCCESDWAVDGQWHWQLANPVPLTEPVPANGALGLWRPKPELLALLGEADAA